MADKNGGSVAPHEEGPWGNGTPGMSRRQWLAGLAMCGIWASNADDYFSIDKIASLAYNQADAMLAEEEKRYGKNSTEK
jgi:hypothetical protein